MRASKASEALKHPNPQSRKLPCPSRFSLVNSFDHIVRLVHIPLQGADVGRIYIVPFTLLSVPLQVPLGSRAVQERNILRSKFKKKQPSNHTFDWFRSLHISDHPIGIAKPH